MHVIFLVHEPTNPSLNFFLNPNLKIDLRYSAGDDISRLQSAHASFSAVAHPDFQVNMSASMTMASATNARYVFGL